MGLFTRKKKEEEKKQEEVQAPKAAAPEKKGPSISNIKVPEAKTAAPAAQQKAAPTAKAPSAAKVAPKKAAPAPAKAPAAKPAAPAKPAAAVAKKAPAKAPASKVPAGVTIVPRPFFMKTEEDVRLAFDQAIAEAEAQIAKNGAKAVGKYEFELEVDGFHFYLVANNGQVLFDSPSFTTLIGALKGIETFKKTVAEGTFDIRVDKYDRYRFILERKYYGENYTTKDQCQKCAESVKNFANNAKIIRYTPTKEAIAAFEAAKVSKRSPDDIDWKAIAKAEEESPKMGKFEICKEADQYAFYLLANNGQILYSSRYYATEAACRKGVDSFKRAAYVGNFFVDRDKFGNFRYVLKNIGSAPAFIGESYDNKPQCEKIIESVKKFIVSATVELEEKA
ncbi:MAG: YegP family protein [Clostridia bacterium]|nr:YegP family protein [Clostridia bacterium]